MAESNREALAKYHGKRIGIKAIYEREGEKIPRNGREVATALVECVELNDATAESLASHCWIQFAENLTCLDLRRGDRITCTCVVNKFVKTDSNTGETYTDWSLQYPAEVHTPDLEEMAPQKPRARFAPKVKPEVNPDNRGEKEQLLHELTQLTDIYGLAAVKKALVYLDD